DRLIEITITVNRDHWAEYLLSRYFRISGGIKQHRRLHGRSGETFAAGRKSGPAPYGLLDPFCDPVSLSREDQRPNLSIFERGVGSPQFFDAGNDLMREVVHDISVNIDA